MSRELPRPRLDADGPGPYQPPDIETVLTREDLEREVKYAGEQSPIPG